MVAVQVGAHLRVNTRGATALAAGFQLAAVHAIHVGRRAAQVGQVAFETGHLLDLLYLPQDAGFRPIHDKLALVGRYGAEGAAAETPAVQVDGELDHLEGGDALATVLGVGQARVGQVERVVQLCGAEGRVGRLHGHPCGARLLPQALRIPAVGLFLNMAEVLGMQPRCGQGLLVGVQHDVGRTYVGPVAQIGYLFHVGRRLCTVQPQHVAQHAAVYLCVALLVIVQVGVPVVYCLGEQVCQPDGGLLAHAVYNKVCPGVNQDAGAEPLLPVVVVHQPPQRGLDATEHHRDVGVELAQDVCIDNGGILRAQVVAAVGAVGILRAQASCRGVFVYHGVHAPRGDAEPQAWAPQLAEVAVVAMPVGLRHDGYTQALCLEQTAYDGRAERGVVHVGIGAEQNHVGLCPPPRFHLASGGGQPTACVELCLVGHAERGL